MILRHRYAVVVMLLLGSACLSPPQIVCDEGTCAASTTCARVAGYAPTICARDIDLALCVEQMIGAACGPNRFCVESSAGPLCIDSICGDNIRTGNEICDDNNAINGDGCSRDCLSTETCGNGIVDGAVGEQCDDAATSAYGRSGDGCNSTCATEGYLWSDVSAVGVQQRSEHVMAYDITRKVVVLFGGQSANSEDDDPRTWEFDGDTWSPWRGVSDPPPPLREAAMTYDSDRKLMVLTGGRTATGIFNDHVWEFNGEWVDRGRVPALARRNHIMAYDTNRKKVVVYGGTSFASGLDVDDVWEYDGQQWAQNLAPSPPARSEAAAGYDEVRHRLVLFGGRVNQVPVAETWEFDGTTWIARTGLISQPPAIAGHTMYFDATSNVIVEMGLAAGSGPLDSWIFDGQNWTQATAISSVNGRLRHAVAFDRSRSIAVLFGGQPAVRVPFDTIHTEVRSSGNVQQWSSFTFNVNPPAIFGMSSAFDIRRGTLVMFGGGLPSLPLFTDTWEYASGQWQLRALAASPPATSEATMVYDVARGVAVLFGGTTNVGINNDTWEYDGAHWMQRVFAVAPPARSLAAATFDTGASLLLLTGGQSAGLPLRDTWSFDGNSWTRRSDLPITVFGHSVLYDPALHRMVLFGGKTGSAVDDVNSETFIFDGNGWTPLASALPFAATGMAAAYDPTTRHVVVQTPDETWYLDGATWRRSQPLTLVPQLQSSTLQYDSVNQSMLLVGIGNSAPTGPQTRIWSLGFTLNSKPRDRCIAGSDADGDGLIACGDGTEPTDPTHNADPDCYGRCFPLCELPSAAVNAPCDLSQPRCGDGACNPSLEDRFLCPTDCP
jgi:cysteine-rich repeat protein